MGMRLIIHVIQPGHNSYSLTDYIFISRSVSLFNINSAIGVRKYADHALVILTWETSESKEIWLQTEQFLIAYSLNNTQEKGRKKIDINNSAAIDQIQLYGKHLMPYIKGNFIQIRARSKNNNNNPPPL